MTLQFAWNQNENSDFLHNLGPRGVHHLDAVLMLLFGYGAMLRLELCLLLTQAERWTRCS